MEQNKIKLFISHSSKDERIVRNLVTLIKNAFSISAKEIRCTTLSGYGLDIGSDTIEVLRKEAIQAKAFVGVLTPNALSSEFTMLEIGCRWGLGKKNSFLPIVCDRKGTEILKGPIRFINPANAYDTSSIHSFIVSLGKILDIQKEEPDVYDKDVKRLANSIKRIPSESSDKGDPPNAKLEMYAVKAIAAEFELWLNAEDKKEDEDSYQRRVNIVTGDYNPGGVFRDILDMYIKLMYERIDKRFEVEKLIRNRYGIGIDNKRVEVVKEEAYEIAKEYYNTAVDLARLNTERHLANYYPDAAYNYKYEELNEMAERMKQKELSGEKKYIETKTLELEAACNISVAKTRKATKV